MIQTGSITLSSTPEAIKVQKTNNNIIVITAKSTNSGVAFIGNKTEVEASNAFELEAGYRFEFEMGDLTVLYVKGTASDKVSYLINGESA